MNTIDDDRSLEEREDESARFWETGVYSPRFMHPRLLLKNGVTIDVGAQTVVAGGCESFCGNASII